MTGLVVAVTAVAGLVVGGAVNRAAGAFPWGTAATADRRPAVRLPLLELATAALFALVALRFGAAAELPAFLVVAAAGVLLTVIDLRHRLLPNRVVLPALGVTAVLLALAAVVDGSAAALLRAGLGGAALFGGYLVLALINPRGLGMGDVKLAALLGIPLGWLGWQVLLLGAVAGFVVQAVLALLLLAGRRIDLEAELPFGPAMLLGAALAVGWSGTLPG
ncbi:prepilin peptidase [Blastococcus xanthinilyticus]|uniref:Leader peptidase (Prepilin peptidase)/N-methyltransferase n=1 Tax=Blastococcus xanthinilyticus TaxID=1564164 RepID=A0A5S5CY67_9ACTN|nr:A24 family peptidase [Blastococcus xanthinilyticus]TYP88495.1 leader peptidase (prepilin peptidase)/N-methyltransferase [Blastococcus xanthinilyticus]